MNNLHHTCYHLPYIHYLYRPHILAHSILYTNHQLFLKMYANLQHTLQQHKAIYTQDQSAHRYVYIPLNAKYFPVHNLYYNTCRLPYTHYFARPSIPLQRSPLQHTAPVKLLKLTLFSRTFFILSLYRYLSSIIPGADKIAL